MVPGEREVDSCSLFFFCSLLFVVIPSEVRSRALLGEAREESAVVPLLLSKPFAPKLNRICRHNIARTKDRSGGQLR
jgi:hypothetical protein